MQGLMMETPLTLTSIFEHAVRYFGRKEIVTQRPEGPPHRYTYAECGRRVRRLARALQQAGIGPGDRVATFAWNTYEHLECYYAIPCLGAVMHTVNIRLHPDQLAFIINDAEDQVIFCDRSVVAALDQLAGRLPTVRLVVLMGPGSVQTCQVAETVDYEAFLASADGEVVWPELDEDSAAAMCYTSGTTGNPKGVVYSHRSSYLHSLTTALVAGDGARETDRYLPVVPMFHANAWGGIYAFMLVGADIVLPDRFLDPQHLLQFLRSERVTVTAGVPSVWTLLLAEMNRTGERLPDLHAILCGGSAAPAALIAGFDQVGLRLYHAWGMTETSPVGTHGSIKSYLRTLPEAEQLALRAKQGFPLPGVELRIVDLATGERCPEDGTTSGEIQVRGPWICRAYYHDEQDADHRFTTDGWLRTGDVGTVDAEGYLEIVDRTKDLVKSGGEWISSVQLENTIMAHPQVLEAAVIGVPHPKWSERPVAVVVPRADAGPALTQAAIQEFVRDQVASWWVPDAVVFVKEIPKTSVGKFDKKRLRTELPLPVLG